MTGDGATPIRLSEQQALDCIDKAEGCNGGFTSFAWDYWKTYGAMTDAEYPYKAVDGTCKHNATSTELYKTVFRGQITTGISGMID